MATKGTDLELGVWEDVAPAIPNGPKAFLGSLRESRGPEVLEVRVLAHPVEVGRLLGEVEEVVLLLVAGDGEGAGVVRPGHAGGLGLGSPDGRGGARCDGGGGLLPGLDRGQQGDELLLGASLGGEDVHGTATTGAAREMVEDGRKEQVR